MAPKAAKAQNAAGKSNSAASRRGRAARWTDEQVKLLLDTVAKARTAQEAFREVAERLGKTPGTVQQKYYTLQRRNGRSRGSAARRPGRPRATASTSASAGTRRPTGATVDMSAMSNTELATLVREATRELEARMRQLEVNVRKLLG